MAMKMKSYVLGRLESKDASPQLNSLNPVLLQKIFKEAEYGSSSREINNHIEASESGSNSSR